MPGTFSPPPTSRKPLVSNPGMHYVTCITHVSRCMSGSLTCGGGKNVSGIPGACATRNLPYLVRGPCKNFRFAHKISWPVASSVLKYIQTDKTNTLGPGQNGCHVADYISNLIFLYENCCILMYISLNFFVLDGPTKNTRQHWFRQWHDTERRQGIIWTKDCLAYWRIYASLGLDDLKLHPFSHSARRARPYISRPYVSYIWLIWCIHV